MGPRYCPVRDTDQVDADRPTLLIELETTSSALAATSKRTEKREALAALLGRLQGDEIEIAVAALAGEVRQGRIGVGWATLRDIEVPAADESVVTLAEFDRWIDELAADTGPGSTERRRTRIEAMWERLTGAEQRFVFALLGGELRHGALDGVMVDAVAAAAGVPATVVRRAHMLRGDLPATAVTALTGGRPALEAVGLELLRPIQPMLASTAADVAEAFGVSGPEDDAAAHAVEWKIDGVRVQVHRHGDEVLVVTRNLNDVTARLPGLVADMRALEVERFVLDGEVIGVGSDSDSGDDDSAVPAFQDTASQFSNEAGGGADLAVWFFDAMHVDGVDLLDHPWTERRRALEALVGDRAVPMTVTDDAVVGTEFFEATVAAGHEGVMVKQVDTTYEAGRRGKSWRKIKPVITLDLVVLGAEWGHGRRTGRLSNLHLGARDPNGGPPIMVGKTFKGLTDELLAWQTERLLELAEDAEAARQGHFVPVPPVLVIEIAIDGVQTSTRYPGGAALRFARVRGYRPDKTADEADTIDAVTALRR